MHRVLHYCLLVVSAICVIACCSPGSTPSSSSGTSSGPGTPSKPDLEVSNVTDEVGEFGTHYIVGTVTNNSGRTYGYAQVEFNLYDASGAQVGSTMDNINNLEPGVTWKFKAIMMEGNATQYKLKGVTGF